MDNYELLDFRGETIPGAARFFSAGRGITMPEPGRITVPYWINTEDEGRKAVQELAATRSISSSSGSMTREGKFKKLRPTSMAPIIDEAHKRGLRVTAHIFDLEDAKGLLRAGIDAFAHGVRDKDIDDETVALFKARRTRAHAEPAGPRRQDRPELAAGPHPGRRAARARGGEHR